MGKEVEQIVKVTDSVLGNVSGIWDLILNHDRIKDTENDIVLQIFNYTGKFLRIELERNPNMDNNWDNAKNNCALLQPFVEPVFVNPLSGIPTPGTGSVVWDNAKLEAKIHFQPGMHLDFRKEKGERAFAINLIGRGGTNRGEQKHFTRQAFSRFGSCDGIAIGLTYADDTNTFVLMVLPTEQGLEIA